MLDYSEDLSDFFGSLLDWSEYEAVFKYFKYEDTIASCIHLMIPEVTRMFD